MQPQKLQGAQAAPTTGTRARKVLVDGNTIELARQLGISVEEYLDSVVHFFLHPPQEPLLSVVEAPEPRDEGRQESPEPRPLAGFPEVRSAAQRKAG